jgi:hypothetical protein
MMFFSSIMQKSPDTGFKFSVTCVLLPYYLLSLEFSLENHEYFSSNPSSFTKKHNLDNKSRVQGCKKSIASLQVCVLTLHRNHANLLCIVKRLFNARPAGRATFIANLMYIN